MGIEREELSLLSVCGCGAGGGRRGERGSSEALWFSLSLAALEGEIERGERERSRGGGSGLGLWRGWALGQVDCGEERWAGLGCLSPLSLSHSFFNRKELERRKEREG